MNIAVALLTCGRLSNTAETLKTLLAHNPWLRGGALYYADDASPDPDGMFDLCKLFGFKPVVQNQKRWGCSPTSRSLLMNVWRRVRSKPGKWGILYLQNDWTSVKPIPVDDIELAFSSGVGWFRLYGEYKDYACKQRASTKNLGTGKRVTWWPLSGKVSIELALIHWCFCPSVTRLDVIPKLFVEPIARESDVIRRSVGLACGARVVENVMFHAGTETTPGGLFGRPRGKK